MEMARVFRIPVGRSIRYVYLPQVMPYFLSAGLRSGPVLEVRDCRGGHRYAGGLYRASSSSRPRSIWIPPDLFAWTLVIVLVSLAFERAFLALLRRGARAMERM